jgi:hypothetical protein
MACGLESAGQFPAMEGRVSSHLVLTFLGYFSELWIANKRHLFANVARYWAAPQPLVNLLEHGGNPPNNSS